MLYVCRRLLYSELPYNHDHGGSGSPTAMQIKTITKITFASTQGDHTLYVNHNYK
jgi:hypothetical protein